MPTQERIFNFPIAAKYLRKIPTETTHSLDVVYKAGEVPGHKVAISISNLIIKPNTLNYLSWEPSLFTEILEAAKQHNIKNS